VAKLQVKLQPGASRDEIVGWEGDALRVRVTSPPVEGRANRALIELLAKRLRVAKSNVSISAGLAARSKVVSVEGLDETELRRLLP
jgi:uncharacterized protein